MVARTYMPRPLGATTSQVVGGGVSLSEDRPECAFLSGCDV